MAWSTPRTWSTGERVTAAHLNQEVRDNLNAAFPLGPGAWTPYSPTHSNITVGNGTQVAKYTRIGQTVTVHWALVFGSTTTFGGNIGVGLPVPAASGASQATMLGAAYAFDNGTAEYSGVARRNTDSLVRVIFNTTVASTTAPFVWTTNDQIGLTVTYEAAS